MKVLLASRNPGKLREFAELLPGFELVLWPEGAPEIPETGAFFSDNALQKAAFARQWWKDHGTGPVAAVLADPAVQKQLADGGMKPMQMAPADFGAYLAKERKALAAVITANNIKAE